MSTVTPRLGLVKPAGIEQFSRATYNNNLDSIDSQVVKLTEFMPAWTDLTSSLVATWVAYTGGGSYRNGLFARKVGDMIHLQGAIKSGAAGSTIITLPSPFIPAYSFVHMVEAGTAGTLGTILFTASTNVVTYRAGPAAPTIMTINVLFPAA